MSDIASMNISVTADISDLKQKIADAGGVTTDFAKMSADSFNQISPAIDNASNSTIDLRTRVSDLKAGITDLTGALSINRSNLASVSDELIALKASGTGSVAAIASLDTQVQSLRGEQVGLTAALAGTKAELNATTIALKEQASASVIAQRSQDAIGKSLNRFTDINLVASREINNLGRRLINIGSIAAFSLLSEGLSQVLPLIGEVISSLGSAGNEASKLALSAKEIQKNFNSVNDTSGQEQAKVLTLVTALQSKTLSYQQQTAALKELKQISPEYFQNLDIEKGKIDGLTTAYDNYKKSILAAIQNKVDEKTLEKIQSDLNSFGISDALNKVVIANNQKAINDLYAKGGALYADQLKTQNSILSNDGNKKNLLDQQDEILKRMAGRNFDGLIKPADFKVPKGLKTIQDILAELERQLDFLNTKQIILKTDEAKEQISAIQSTIETLIKTKGLTADNPIILRLLGEVQDANIKENVLGVLNDALKELQKEKGFNPADPIALQLHAEIKALQLVNPLKNVQQVLQQELSDLRIVAIKVPIELAPVPTPTTSVEKIAQDKVNNPLGIPQGTQVFPSDDQTNKAKGNFNEYTKGYLGLIAVQQDLTREGVIFADFQKENYPVLTAMQKDYTDSIKKYGNEIKGGSNKLAAIETSLDFDVKISPQSLKSFKEATANFSKSATDLVQQTAANIGTVFGEALGDAITGRGDLFKGLFDGLIHTLGAGLVQLGEQTILASSLIKSLTAAFKIDPAAALPIGIALVTFGTVLENLSSGGLKGFAGGGLVQNGGTFMVGERGPEILKLPQGSNITPNSSINSMSRPADGELVASYTVRGQDMLVVINRATASKNRNT